MLALVGLCGLTGCCAYTTMAQSKRLEEQKKVVRLNPDTVWDVHTATDEVFDLSRFKENFKVNVLSSDDREMVFELIGIDAPLANAFRRILIAEVGR